MQNKNSILFSSHDLYLFGEGTLLRAWEKMGAHPRETAAGPGTAFAVWAPNARAVGVAGDFNGWQGERHPLAPVADTGIWAGHLPGAGPGDRYKFEIVTRDNRRLLKSDPWAFAAEPRPGNASVICADDAFPWRDRSWLEARRQRDHYRAPLSIYEAHLGSWQRDEHGRFLNYRELAPRLAEHLDRHGFNCLEIMPVTEHPLDESWGYQTTGYFAPTSRYGSPADFAWFVDYLHRHGIAVIMDWAPAHFPDDEHGLAAFDGTCLYEHADQRQQTHPDWGTRVFNYGRCEVAGFLINSALFWLDRYHVDGLRIDAVASMLYLDYSRPEGGWVPNRHGGRENLEAIAFLKRLNEAVYRHYPGAVTIAEESTAWPQVSRPTWLGGLGFGFKWNMGWMNDSLRYIALDPIHRKYHHQKLTFSLVYAFHENFVLPVSHDEVVHGKGSLLSRMPGGESERFANARLYLGYMFTHPGRKLLFMGSEFGQWREWSEGRALDWELLSRENHRQLLAYVGDLNRLYRSEPPLHERDDHPEGFAWIDFQDVEGSVIAYERFAADRRDSLVVVLNFTPVTRTGYRIGVREAGCYREKLNSDSRFYGGGNTGNQGGRASEPRPWNGRPHSLELTLPPLAVLVLKRAGDRPRGRQRCSTLKS